jgi:co-chaperonin GroES (HSP10)
MPVGDRLARGDASAQFSTGAGLSDFQHDLAVRPEIVSEKYGLSQVEVAQYLVQRERGEALPDLKAVDTDEAQDIASGISIVDKRHTYDSQPVKKAEKKFQDKEYSDPSTILDRILVKRIPEDEEKFEILEDGSLRNKETGFVIPYAYRQHNNIGIVLAVGQFVVLGGLKVPMGAIVRPGDRVTFGDYNSEVYKQPTEKTKKMCDAVQMNYEADEEGLRVVRVQDIRTVEHPKQMSWFKTLLVSLRTMYLTQGVYDGRT